MDMTLTALAISDLTSLNLLLCLQKEAIYTYTMWKLLEGQEKACL